MGTNLNLYPYFDDYSADKGFHRLLFKPGYAVQARELTQLQTILQDQIRRFGDHIFKDGTVVFGCAESFNFDFPYVKILDARASGGGTISSEELLEFKGKIVEGVNSNVRAIIKEVSDGVETDPQNHKTLFVQYISSGGSGVEFTGTVHSFLPGEVLRIKDGANTFTIANVDKDPIGSSSFFSIDDGIIYIDGSFVIHKHQNVLLDRYSNTPTKKVGFTLETKFANWTNDKTLLDPARGFYNFAAPGADRLVLTTKLEARDIDAEDDANFFLLFEVEDGVTKRKYNKTTYAELRKELARRTYDESGNYTVRPFSIIVRDHLKGVHNNGKYTEAQGGVYNLLAIGVEPGKAYVSGFEYETYTTEYIPVPKGTDTKKVLGQTMSTNYGSFVIVDSLSGPWALNTGDTVTLINQTVETVNWGSVSNAKLGTARVRSVAYIPGSGVQGTTGARYRVYLYDFKWDSAADANTWKAIHRPTSSPRAAANIVLIGNKPVVYASDKDAMLFTLPYESIKTLEPNSSPDIDYVYKKVMSLVGTPSLELTGGETWPFSGTLLESFVTDTFIITNNEDGTIIDPTGKVTWTSPTSLLFNLTLGSSGATIILPVKKNAEAIRRTKSKQTRCIKINTTGRIGGQPTEEWETLLKAPYSLGVPDVLKIENVWMASTSQPYTATPASPAWEVVTDEFTFVSNVKDTMYDTAFIVPKDSLFEEDPNNTGNPRLKDKKLIVEFSYFTHNNGSFFTVDSYPVNDSNPNTTEIRTEDIPKHVSAAGVVYDLRNTIDFRPSIVATVTPIDKSTIGDNTIAENPGFSTDIFTSGLHEPDPFNTVETNLEHYLGRYDKVALTNEGDFISIKGTAAIAPEVPGDISGAMTLAILTIPPYPSLSPFVARKTNKVGDEVKVKLVDNRRYTMADIGLLANRVNRLEHHTKISTLEQEAINTNIISSTGQNRFKNGILVDSFSGHGIGNVLDPNYSCSVDPKKGELRPRFEIDCLRVERLSGLVAHGDLITLPYTDKLFASNNHASKPRNCVSALLFNYEGHITLDPPQDIWNDVDVQPDVQVNLNGSADNWQVLNNAWGTQWGSWNTLWTGEEVGGWGFDNNTITQTINNFETQSRTGTRINVQAETITQPLGNRVVSASIIPFMRSIPVRFHADNLKPNTRLYAFFDKEDVTVNCSLLENGIPVVGNLLTDEFGRIDGEFVIPAGRFRTGNKAFVLTDDPLNRSAWATTYAVELFSASGIQMVTQGSTISTRIPRVTFDTITETRDIVTSRQVAWDMPFNGIDPLAQTFYVSNNPGGMYLSKMDVFFQAKDPNAPITLQIREVVNGYPSGHIVPFGTVTLLSSSVNESEDGSVATTFNFETPVYLKDETEYCFVLLPAGNSDKYKVWVAELGQFDIVSGNRISEQAAAGVLFISANNRTWTALQSEDVKFKIYQAWFDTTPLTVTFRNEWVNDDVKINAISPMLTSLEFASARIGWEYKIYTSTGTPPSGYSSVTNNDVLELDGEYAVFSGAGETYPDGTLNFRATLSSDTPNLSPAIDIKKIGCLVTSNNVTSTVDTTSKYISRAMPLDLPAEDLQVILSQKLVGTSRIEVYARVQSDLDPFPFENLPWVKMDTNQVILRGGYSSYTYVLPTYNSSSTPEIPGLNSQGVVEYVSESESKMIGFNKFAIRIAFLSGNTWEVPKVKDLKAIALMA
jgi:hypothetical protein